jgi:predicted permease
MERLVVYPIMFWLVMLGGYLLAVFLILSEPTIIEKMVVKR